MLKGFVMFVLIATVFAHDSVEFVQKHIAPGTPTEELVQEVVAAAEEKVRAGANLVDTVKTAAHAAADAVKQLDAMDDKPADVVVNEEVSIAKDVLARLMDTTGASKGGACTASQVIQIMAGYMGGLLDGTYCMKCAAPCKNAEAFEAEACFRACM